MLRFCNEVVVAWVIASLVFFPLPSYGTQKCLTEIIDGTEHEVHRLTSDDGFTVLFEEAQLLFGLDDDGVFVQVGGTRIGIVASSTDTREVLGLNAATNTPMPIPVSETSYSFGMKDHNLIHPGFFVRFDISPDIVATMETSLRNSYDGRVTETNHQFSASFAQQILLYAGQIQIDCSEGAPTCKHYYDFVRTVLKSGFRQNENPLNTDIYVVNHDSLAEFLNQLKRKKYSDIAANGTLMTLVAAASIGLVWIIWEAVSLFVAG